jgi:hypothetical protein
MPGLTSTPDSPDDESVLVATTDSEIDLSEPESLDDYVISKPIKKQRESTRSQISLWLLICFSASLIASYVLVCVAAIVPGVDKTIIKDSLPLLLTPQVTLLGVALGFYFGKGK